VAERPVTLRALRAISCVARIARVSREMILSFLTQHDLHLPRSY
jgi:hypothetical protein